MHKAKEIFLWGNYMRSPEHKAQLRGNGETEARSTFTRRGIAPDRDFYSSGFDNPLLPNLSLFSSESRPSRSEPIAPPPQEEDTMAQIQEGIDRIRRELGITPPQPRSSVVDKEEI